MADVKVSGLPVDSSLDGNHYTILNDPTGPTTKRTLLSTLAAFFFNQTNIPDGSGSPRTRMTEIEFDFVASGLVWSGDAYASTRLASMTSGVIYINGRRLTISAVVSRTFTASKDTYIDVLDNGDGTATIVYTEVANNAASPALAANSVRIGIIVTGATNIAAVGSVNQGQFDKVLPIASSMPYMVTDSLGNLICPRDPTRKVLGCRRRVTDMNFAGETEVVELVTPIKLPTSALGRKIKITLFGTHQLSGAAAFNDVRIYKGRLGSSPTLLTLLSHWFAATSQSDSLNGIGVDTPTTESNTYSVTCTAGSGTSVFKGATTPGYLMVEFE